MLQKNRTLVRAGFTLVEILVVVVIIILLAAILTPALYSSITKAKEARVGIEIANLSKALERYKIEYGEYPPDFSELAGASDRVAAAKQIIADHLQRVFRRRDQALDLPSDPNQLANLGPHNALYFWLRGFSSDPTVPLFGSGDRQPFLDFDQARLDVAVVERIVRNGAEVVAAPYFPKATEKNTPYIYYRSSSYPFSVPSDLPGSAVSWALTQTVLPSQVPVPYFRYFSPTTSSFAEPEKFQLLCAGRDGDYWIRRSPEPFDGTQPDKYPYFPNGTGYRPEDNDNLTNFSEGKTLEDSKPE